MDPRLEAILAKHPEKPNCSVPVRLAGFSFPALLKALEDLAAVAPGIIADLLAIFAATPTPVPGPPAPSLK